MYESNREPESSATSSQVLVQKKKYIFVWELDNWVFLDKYHSQFLQIWDKLQRPLNLLLRNLFGISDFKSFNFTNILDVSNIGFRIPHSSSNVEHGTLNTSSNLRDMTEKLKQIQALYKYFKKLSLFEDLLKNCGINSAEFIKFFDNFETMPDVNILLYKEIFNLVNEGGHQNVIVSNKTTCATIAGALGRLLLYRMGEHVEAENVYCIDNSLEFKQIIGKFQKDSIIIVTRNIETKQFAFQ
uniref:Uncharacterized protein n=1 Tax=Meloidogyne javanica TaxID=6303 RepID=A0A915MNU7_MELJA